MVKNKKIILKKKEEEIDYSSSPSEQIMMKSFEEHCSPEDEK
tara:strand:- start:1386 stop:1511 length:126 start_codon:yes stop_codon:yes gene_type:complete